MAQVIAGSWLFIGNPSSPFWCAESLKHPLLLEVGKPRNWHFQRWGQLYGDDEWVLLPDLDNLERRFSRNVIGRADGRTLLDQGRLLNIAQLALTCRDLEGDAAELGIYQCGCSAVIASTLPGKTLHLFDTFQRLHQDNVSGCHHKTGDFLTGQDKAAEYLAGYKTEFHVGVFPTTTRGMADKTFGFVHVDGDLYQSTIDTIDYFWPRTMAGGIMVFDDWK